MSKKAIKLLQHARAAATLERASLGNMWPDPADPLPTSEDEVTDFIRRRLELHHSTWVLGPIDEVLAMLEKRK